MNNLTLIIDSVNWEKQTGFDLWKANLQKIFDSSLKEAGFDQGSFSANLLLTNNETIQDLNSRFRQKDVPTNVLSFPQIQDKKAFQESQDFFLGDIAISYEKILEESNDFNIEFFDRLTHLLVHGILHLIGFDHIQEDDRKNMENLEIKILDFFGVQDPYGDKIGK